jgi:hypothetical protein
LWYKVWGQVSINAIDKNVHQYKVDIYTDDMNGGNFQAPNILNPEMKELRTDDGMHVKRRKQGVYEIIETGVMIYSDSPDAP